MNGYRYGPAAGSGSIPILLGLAALVGVLWLDRPQGGYGFFGHGGGPGAGGYGVAKSCPPGSVFVPQIGACSETFPGTGSGIPRCPRGSIWNPQVEGCVRLYQIEQMPSGHGGGGCGCGGGMPLREVITLGPTGEVIGVQMPR